MNAVYAIEWTESERGWGTRHDGTSYHKSLVEATKYVKDFVAKQPPGPAPDIYVYPGEPKLVEVSADLYETVQQKGMTWK